MSDSIPKWNRSENKNDSSATEPRMHAAQSRSNCRTARYRRSKHASCCATRRESSNTTSPIWPKLSSYVSRPTQASRQVHVSRHSSRHYLQYSTNAVLVTTATGITWQWQLRKRQFCQLPWPTVYEQAYAALRRRWQFARASARAGSTSENKITQKAPRGGV